MRGRGERKGEREREGKENREKERNGRNGTDICRIKYTHCNQG